MCTLWSDRQIPNLIQIPFLMSLTNFHLILLFSLSSCIYFFAHRQPGTWLIHSIIILTPLISINHFSNRIQTSALSLHFNWRFARNDRKVKENASKQSGNLFIFAHNSELKSDFPILMCESVSVCAHRKKENQAWSDWNLNLLMKNWFRPKYHRGTWLLILMPQPHMIW